MDEIFYGMDCRLRKSMKDSIMMSSLLCAMNKAHEKLQSKQGIIGRLIEISKFYELAVMQLEGCLKMVQEETDADNWCFELGHEEVLSDLYMIRNRLKQRLHDTDNTISDMDRALARRLENELNLRQVLEIREKELMSLRDEFDKFQKETVLRDDTPRLGNEDDINELNNCFDKKLLPQFEERIDNNLQNGTLLSDIEPEEQELRWSIEKGIVSSLTEGLLKDMHEEFRDKLRESERNMIVVLREQWSNSMNEIRSLRSELEIFTHEREFSPRARKYVCLDQENYQAGPDHNSVKDEQMNHVEKTAEGDESHHVAKMIKSHEILIRQNSDELKWIKGELVTEKGFRRDYDSPKTSKLQEVIVRLDYIIQLNTCVADDTFCRSGDFQYRENYSLEQNVATANRTATEGTNNFHQSRDEDTVREKMKVKQDSDIHAKMLEETYVILLRGLRNEFYSQLYDRNVEEGTDERSAEDCKIEFQIRETIYNLVLSEKHCNSEDIIKEEIHRIVLEETMKSFLRNDAFASSSRYQEVFRETFPSLEEIGEVRRLEIEDIKICNHIKEDIYQFIVVEAAKDAYALCVRSINSPAADKLGPHQEGREDSFMQKLISALESSGTEENLLKEPKTTGLEHENLDKKVNLEESVVEDEHAFTSLSSKFERTLHHLDESKMILSELGNASGVEVELDMEVDQIAPCKDHSSKEEGEQHFLPHNKEHNHENELRLPELESLILMEFDRVLENFEETMDDKVANNMMRLAEAKHQLEPLRELADSLRQKETSYRKAFIRRCEDLHKAEAEVDLLGDQVDVLLGLLETIYMTLLQHSSVLEKHLGVLDVVKLIRKELATGAPLNVTNS